MSEGEKSQEAKSSSISGIEEQLGRPLTSNEKNRIHSGEPPFKVLDDAVTGPTIEMPTIQEPRSTQEERIEAIRAAEQFLHRQLTPTERARALGGMDPYAIYDNAVNDPTVQIPKITWAPPIEESLNPKRTEPARVSAQEQKPGRHRITGPRRHVGRHRR